MPSGFFVAKKGEDKMKKIYREEFKSLLAVGFIAFGYVLVAVLESIWK